MAIGRSILVTVLFAAVALASSPVETAQRHYNRADYKGALNALLPVENKDAQTWALIGEAHFMSADYKQATDAFEKAVAMEPKNSEYVHWLGKCWGRRAESSSVFTATQYASKARQMFERAVMLDTSNIEALNDLFDYYMQAPGFLGGGLNRAEALVDRIGAVNEAEGHWARAQLADKRKEYAEAEQQLRRALELAPRQVGRVVDLAMYLSKLGRVQESEAEFARAEKMAPDAPKVLYQRARTYIRDKRNLAEARELLKKYLNCELGPNDPPRSEAQELLRKAGA